MVMRKGIEKAVAAAVEAIKGNSQMVSRLRRYRPCRHRFLRRRGSWQALIAEAMEKVTSNGVITIEEGKTAETQSGRGGRHGV